MLRNPFALRNEQIIMIEDVLEEERGLECNCICPACKEPFIARMGEKKVHHFAHSGKGCDELNAYMMGLYMILNDYIQGGNPVLFPEIYVSYELSPRSFITEYNIEEKIRINSAFRDNKNVMKCLDKQLVVFEHSEIISNDIRPEAIIASSADYKIAIRIIPPDTTCAYGKVSRYKDYPTLQIDLSKDGEKIQNYKKKTLFEYIKTNQNIYKWLYNPVVEEKYSFIIQKSKEYYDKCQEQMRLEQERSKCEAEKRAQLEKERREKLEREIEERTRIAREKAEKYAKEKAIRVNQEKVARVQRQQKLFRAERLRSPEKIINYWVNEIRNRDSEREEVGCIVCGKDKLIEEFISVGMVHDVVCGICIDCNEEIEENNLEKLWSNLYDNIVE